MSVKVRYDDDHRMILENLSCDCPCDHAQPNQDIYVGKGADSPPAGIHRPTGSGNTLRGGLR